MKIVILFRFTSLQDYFSSYETGENGRTPRKTWHTRKQNLFIGLFHMGPERG